jgi:heme/copper-type cytochrome/quinol oxidase subunit 2
MSPVLVVLAVVLIVVIMLIYMGIRRRSARGQAPKN